jgi:hypothetical protein
VACGAALRAENGLHERKQKHLRTQMVLVFVFVQTILRRPTAGTPQASAYD